MSTTYTHDVVATVGEYTNNQGEKKKRFVNVGKAFTDEQGRVSLKMETMPVVPEWSGWLSLYPRKDDNQHQQRQGGQRTAAPAPGKAAAVEAQQDEEDSIPF